MTFQNKGIFFIHFLSNIIFYIIFTASPEHPYFLTLSVYEFCKIMTFVNENCSKIGPQIKFQTS